MICLFSSCTTDEKDPFDESFIHIMSDTGASEIVVGSDVNNINTYSIYLSSKSLSENVVVTYEITVGNGLKNGVDYELLTKGNELTFLPGIYDMPIRIQWKPNRVDEAKDNTITIRLMENNLGLTMGLPGPDGLQRELVIEKKNI
jgi:hypothetical protein